jgi:hypothetical protein
VKNLLLVAACSPTTLFFVLLWKLQARQREKENERKKKREEDRE